MLIGELSKKTGLSRHTIRFYEKIKLIDAGQNGRRRNNYKEYDESLVEKLQFINRHKSIGFSLAEVGELISLEKIDMQSCEFDEVSQMYILKLGDLDKKISELMLIKEKLIRGGQRCKSADCRQAFENQS